MANEIVKLGVSTDGESFEQKYLEAAGVINDGITVKEHMEDTAKHIPASGLTLNLISDAGTAANKNAGVASGNVPVLDSSGKLNAAVLPAIAITDTFVVASQSAMLALSEAERGDIAVRTDLNKSFILKIEPYSTLENWQELLTPTSAVQSVAGRTGAVTLTQNDVGLGNVDNTADDEKSVASAVRWTTPRTFNLTGGATGSVSIDGSANISLSVTALDVSKATAGMLPDARRSKDIVFVNSEAEIATSGVRAGGIVLIRI